jgi:hypothetical protein
MERIAGKPHVVPSALPEIFSALTMSVASSTALPLFLG